MIYRSTYPSMRASTHPCTPSIHPPTYHYVLMFSSPELHKNRDLSTAESRCLHRADADTWPSRSPFLGSVAAYSFTIAFHALHSVPPKDTHILFSVAPAKVSQLTFTDQAWVMCPPDLVIGASPIQTTGTARGRRAESWENQGTVIRRRRTTTQIHSLVRLLQPFRKRSRKCIDTDTLRAVRIHMWQTLQWNKQEKNATTRAASFTNDFFFRKCSSVCFLSHCDLLSPALVNTHPLIE